VSLAARRAARQHSGMHDTRAALHCRPDANRPPPGGRNRVRALIRLLVIASCSALGGGAAAGWAMTRRIRVP
jgi:hypothetical protein